MRKTTVVWTGLTMLGLAACGGRSEGVPATAVPPLPEVAGAGLASAGSQPIGAGDLLDIAVYQAPELTREVRVSAEGDVSLPLLGSVQAAGLTPRELEANLRGRLQGTYMVDPQVTVSIMESSAHQVYVLGAVNQPGAFPTQGHDRLTVLRALALGEGLTGTASKDRAVIVRTARDGSRREIPVDIEKVMAGEAADPALEPNDLLYVPSSTTKSIARGLAEALARMVTLGRVF